MFFLINCLFSIKSFFEDSDRHLHTSFIGIFDLLIVSAIIVLLEVVSQLVSPYVR